MDEAEFDKFADEYRAIHARNIRASGETQEFFAAYKISDIAERSDMLGLAPKRILDFGGGTGASSPHLRAQFPNAALTLADVSRRSLEIAEARGVSGVDCVHFDGSRLPFPDGSMDAALAACVFHHIREGEHVALMGEIGRVLGPQGRLWIFEHNPWNPLTRHAVNTCPFDENAVLISAGTLSARLRAAGFSSIRVAYRIPFPKALAGLRRLEPWLAKMPFGTQYYVGAAA